MSDYRETLRRLTVRDEALVDFLAAGKPCSVGLPAFDARACAIARLAALIVTDAALPSYRYGVQAALANGVTADDIVGTLVAVAPVTGVDSVVRAAPKVGLALGYDVEAALERHESGEENDDVPRQSGPFEPNGVA